MKSLLILILIFIFISPFCESFAQVSCKSIYSKSKIQKRDFKHNNDTFTLEQNIEGVELSVEFKKGLESGYHVSFNVNGGYERVAQMKTSTGLKILATVRDILGEFVEEYQPDVLFMAAALEGGFAGKRVKLYKYAGKELVRKYGGELSVEGGMISWTSPWVVF